MKKEIIDFIEFPIFHRSISDKIPHLKLYKREVNDERLIKIQGLNSKINEKDYFFSLIDGIISFNKIKLCHYRQKYFDQ